MFEMINRSEMDDLKLRIVKLEANVIILAEHLISILKNKAKAVEDDNSLFTSKVYLKENITLTKGWRFKESEGVGNLEQILLKSDVNSYHIYILIDDEVNYDNDYSFFFNNSTELEGISAYLKDGAYYLSIRNLKFQKSFSLRLVPTSSTITFNLINIKYLIKDERYITEGVRY